MPAKSRTQVKVARLVEMGAERYRLVVLQTESLEGTLWGMRKEEVDGTAFLMAALNKNIVFFQILESKIKQT